MMQIELQNVTFAYGSPAIRKNALSDITLSVQKGEFVAIVGAAGSGKTTLLQMMAGLLTPNQGKVLLEGKNINEKNVSRKWICHKIGLAFQYPEHQLFEETVIRDVMFGPRNLGWNDTEAEERARQALKQMGIAECNFSGSPFRLSGGEQRKVALAGILALEPEILVLDEPAAGLDPLAKQELLELLKERNEAGQTILFVSHNMDDVAAYAKRLIVLHEGRIVLDDTPAVVFANNHILEEIGLPAPFYARLRHQLCEMGILSDAAGNGLKISIESVKNEIVSAFCRKEAGYETN